MKKILLVCIFFILLNIPIQAQGTVIYFPLILKEGGTNSMIGLQASFENTDTPSTGQVPITAGPVVFLSGYMGQGRQIAQAGTNLILRPSGEIDNPTDGLSNVTSWPDGVAWSTTRYKYGARAWELTFNSVGVNGVRWLTDSTLTINTTYYATVWLWVERTSGTLRLDLTGSGIDTSDILITANTGGWQRFGFSFTTPGAMAFFFGLLRVWSSDFVGSVWVDGLQVEQSLYPTPYLDGSFNGHSWTGAAHASSSTRPACSLHYANPINPPEGFVQFWWNPAANQDGPTRYFFDTDTLAAYFDSFDNKIKFTDGFNTLSTNALTFSADTWQQLQFSWRQGHKAIYQNSVLLVEDNNYVPPDGSGYFYVGSDVNGANQLDGLIDELLVSPIQATPIDSVPTVAPVLCPQTAYNQWQFIQPVESTNYVLNPSAETTLNYSALSGATITRSTTYQKYGLYSYRVQTGANGQGLSLTLSTLGNTSHFATARIRGQLPIKTKFIIGTGIRTPVLISKIDQYWSLYGMAFNASETNGRTELRIIQQGEGVGDFYVDGVQVEPLAYWTTYIDGTQEGCAWNGTENASTSTRSGLSLAGGQLKDFYEDYGFFIEKVIGGGAPPQSLNVDEYAILPGGELNSIKILPRDMTLVGKFITNSQDELNDMQRALHEALSSENYPSNQSLKLIYSGGKVQKEIKVNYKGGLEGEADVFYHKNLSPEGDDWVENLSWNEKGAIQLQATDPYWYEVGESAASLDANDSATFRVIAGRLKSTGQWSNLGPPNAAGTYSYIRTMVEDDQYIYIGGDFLNFDNQANCDYICQYNKQTGLYSPLGTGANDVVRILVIGSDGSLYAGGDFTSMGGVANTSRIAKWDGTTWSALSTGMNNIVRALAIGLDGSLYVGGEFTTAGGGAATRIAKWNGIGWSTLGSGMNVNVQSLTIGLDGSLYAGGLFTTAGGVTVNYVAKWDGSTWSALNGGMDNAVTSVVIGLDGNLYAAGTFTTAGGVAVNKVAVWNGTAWSALGSGIGLGGIFTTLAVGQDGSIYVGGDYVGAGGIAIADRVARWNGYAWTHLDIDLPGAPTVYAILASKYADSVVKRKYNLYLGFDTTGTGYFAGKTTVTNDGNVLAFPKVVFKRTGGTVITIETLKNETTGKELLFDYGLLDGEKLTIDLTPTQKSVISNYFGSRLDAVLKNSDFGTWTLKPGSNDITTFAADPNVVIYPSSLDSFLLWRDKYKSFH